MAVAAVIAKIVAAVAALINANLAPTLTTRLLRATAAGRLVEISFAQPLRIMIEQALHPPD
jgi:hypothetical protein